jgi:hypothetical protein
MQNTGYSNGVSGVVARSSAVMSLALGLCMTQGCTDGLEAGSGVGAGAGLDYDGAGMPGLPDAMASQGSPALPNLPPIPPPPAAFDFDNGNAPIEVVIPAVIPVIFGNVAPGDATIVLRFTTMLTNAWFDATAPYHPTAVGVYSRLGRRPASESETNADMNVAILYASYHTLNSLAPQHAADWDNMMLGLGLDPNDDHEGTEDAVGIGNAAAKAMLQVRENDGFNQLGNEGGRTYNLQPYADYTGYAPVNTAYEVNDPSRWQPSITPNRYGITNIQHYVTPQYALTLPYSYDDPNDFGMPIPDKSNPKSKQPKGNSKHLQAYRAQADEVLAISAALTDEQKAKAELFEDKIRSLGFSTLFISTISGHSLLDFVHYDFLVNAAAFDIGIVVWQEKTKYDTVRPFTAIRWLYGDQEVTAWGGPGMGTVNDLPANEWRSYMPVANHPEYPSGSAAFCAAHAQASRLFFDSDDLGWTVPIPAGSSIIEPGVTPAQDIALHFETWSQFEEDCGYSRMWGGVHFEDAVLASFEVGTDIGDLAFAFFQDHVNGTAP